jgi:HEPN domain-containing protein
MGIGKFTRIKNLSEEYQNLAQQDERVGMNLFSTGEYRHATYFLIQAIEKYLKSKIFSIADGGNKYFRESQRHHSVKKAAFSLVEVITDKLVREQVRSQLNDFVLYGVHFEDLHNDVRYPHYFAARNLFASLSVSKGDAESVCERLKWVKEFIRGLS